MSKYKIFNKIKIDMDKYEEVETDNNEKLKAMMEEKLKSSHRNNNSMKKGKGIKIAASIGVIVVGISIMNPSIADKFIKKLPEFETMLDKIIEVINDDGTVGYDPSRYPEIEENKREHMKSRLVATPINIASKSNGLDITLNKAMYDKKKLYLDMTLRTDEVFEKSKYKDAIGESPYGDGTKHMYINDLQIHINNIKQDGYGYGPGIVELIDENTIRLSYLIELSLENDVEDANFNLNFETCKYGNGFYSEDYKIEGRWSFEFNLKAIDDNENLIKINEKDGDYTLNSIKTTDTYIEVNMELPFQPGLGNPHNNFIIVLDDKGRELPMSSGIEKDNKMYTQINDLIDVGDVPKYVDILVCTNYGEEDNALSRFRVDLSK